ncbi:hypothetical protein [Clostridium kluyveri]|uniref:hypothetical protein n=1 Tax=Clostridium kluyveri TaxID=1534 RepID=UPI0002DB7BB3|nr:hypothetical protein [Clostridium kluyveri]
MIGEIIDMNVSHALISFQDGTTKDVNITHLPSNSKIGDRVNINPNSSPTLNDKLNDIYPMNIF